MRSWIVFCVAATSGLCAASGTPLQRSLNATQQLRSLVPERNYEEMFNINIQQDAFEAQLKESPCSCEVAQGQGYFLFATTSGEPIRILDLYEQFQFSPFWRVPELVEELRQVEKIDCDSDIQ